jgi:hypothetical protein
MTGQGRPKIPDQIFLDQRIGRKKVHEELTSTLGDDAYGRSQFKIWRNAAMCCGRPPLTSDPQREPFPQNYQFASAREIANHFPTTVPAVKEILQRELETRKFARHWVPRSLSSHQQVPGVEASTEMLRILQESQASHFDGSATGHEFWFQCLCSSSEMSVHS